MGSLTSRAQPWPRARPADMAHAWSSRSGFAHQAVRGAHGVILTVLSTGGTGISCGSGACLARARPVSAPPTTDTSPPRPSCYHSLSTAYVHLQPTRVRFVAAEYCEVVGRHHQHRGRPRGRLRGGLQRDSRRLRALLDAVAAAAGSCQAAWSCEAADNAAVSAQARCSYVRAAWAVCPHACGRSGDAILIENAVCDVSMTVAI